jgi:hypothetical protein
MLSMGFDGLEEYPLRGRNGQEMLAFQLMITMS